MHMWPRNPHLKAAKLTAPRVQPSACIWHIGIHVRRSDAFGCRKWYKADRGGCAAQVMRRLRGSLNVAQLKGAFEDATDVHIVMEWCKGGELWHRIGRAHYSERTVRAL
jgi:serine/threonine protein kinase